MCVSPEWDGPTRGSKIKKTKVQAMAIPGGYRFRVPFDDVFPQGCYVMSVERARDYNNGKPKDAVDPVSGKPVYAIQVTDPSAKGKNTGQVVKMAVEVQPVPPEAIPGTLFRPGVFTERSAVPYVRDGWISYTLWAKEMHSALPTGTAAAARSQGKAGSFVGGSAQDAA